MARKRQEIQLQQEIETQEEWEDMVSKEGVWVVDVYQEWCGPCQGMSGNFRKYRNEISDELLKFAVAKADTIDSLEKYRGKCEPCFMFYAGGVLVAIVRGANAPLILRTITEQLAYEHKVMEGTAERKEIKDTVIAMLEKDKKEEGDEEEKEEVLAPRPPSSQKAKDVKKEVTLCLIKPDAVQAGKAEDIKNELRQRGIEILREEERQLTEEEAKMIYGNLKDQTFYPDLIKFMTSGPSHILVITKGKTGQNIIKEFRDIMGPTDVEEAKEKAPDSLRAKYGKDTMMNCLHGSSSEDMAERELAFFFPDFVAPTVEGKPKLQRTLALIRPDAFKLHKDAILQKIHEAGFSVAMQKELQLSKEQVEEFYSEHKGQPYFEELTTRMTSGPLLALGLAREDAVQGWRQMLGPHEVQKAKEEAPESLRAQFSVDDTPLNQLHGSSSAADAEKELKFFFPVEQTVAVIKPDAYGTKEEIIEKIHEAGFRIAARKETKLTREMAEEFYADHKDKEYFNNLVEHMISGPTFFMILSREDAVQGWRELIGPTDPEKAKENPETLRAQYGKDVLQNAVHGSSNPDHAKESIKKIFEEEGGTSAKSTKVTSVNVEQPKSKPTAEQFAPETGIKAESKIQGASMTEGSLSGNESKTAESVMTHELKSQEASLTQSSKVGVESKIAESAITAEQKTEVASVTHESNESKGSESSKLKPQETSVVQESKVESETTDLVQQSLDKGQVGQESYGKSQVQFQSGQQGHVEGHTEDQSKEQGHLEGQAQNEGFQNVSIVISEVESIKDFEELEREPVNVVRKDSADVAPEYRRHEASKEAKEKEAKAETPQPPPEPEPEPAPEPEEKHEAHKGGQEKNKEQDEVTGSGEAQPKVEDSKPDEPSETEAKPSSETEAKPSSETEAKPSSETEAKPSSETEAKPDDKKGDEQKTEEKENDKNEGQKEGET